MNTQLVKSSIVIIAKQFNPSIVSQLWLTENELVKRDDFGSDSMYSEMIVNLNTKNFILLVTPEQIQVTPTNDNTWHESVGFCKKLASTLPHTPYTAVGLNFVWILDPEDLPFSDFNSKCFKNENLAFLNQYNDISDFRFGTYFSGDVFGCRMKVDIKPVRLHSVLNNEREVKEFMQFAFNFNHDIESKGKNVIKELQDHLDLWENSLTLSRTIVGNFLKS